MTYEYVCEACGHQWEAEQSIKDQPLKKCDSCGKNRAKRLVSGGTGFLLKGGGWYADGYGSGGKAAKGEAASKSEATPGKKEASSDTKPSSDAGSSKDASSGSSSGDGTSKSAAAKSNGAKSAKAS